MQTVKNARRKLNRARIFLEKNERHILWSKGDDVIIYRPVAIQKGK